MALKVFVIALLAATALAEPEPRRGGRRNRWKGCFTSGRFNRSKCGRPTGSGAYPIRPTGGFNSTVTTSEAIPATTAAPVTSRTRAPVPIPTDITTDDSTTTTYITVTPSAPAPIPTTRTRSSRPAPAPPSSVPAPAPPSSSAPVPAPSSPPSGTFNKKGLSFTNPTQLADWSDPTYKVGWTYNWWTTRGDVPASMEYYPMMWCPTKLSETAWRSDAAKAIAGGSKRLLGFNEPDEPKQCEIPVADAVAGHQKYMNGFDRAIKIGSPAVTNGGSPKGLTYMTAFLKGCAGNCTIDFMNVHWYGNSAQQFKDHVGDAIKLATDNDIPEVWVTEFEPTGVTDAQKAAFIKEVIPWLDAQEKVGGYAYFMATDGKLNANGKVSPVVGQAYASSS